jgi:arsenate reductase
MTDEEREMGRSRSTLRGATSMRVLAAILMLTVVCVASRAAADEATQRQVVFVCEHGNVKSVMAASYFNQLAEQQHLPFRAISRGSAPNSTTVPKAVAAGLRADGVDVSDFHAAKIAAADVAAAERIVTIGTELPADVRADEPRIEKWDDVPPASSDFAAARASLRRHVAELIRRLQQAGGS